MKKLPSPITQKTFEEVVYKWMAIINRKESGSIINLSGREQPWRVNQFLQDKKIINQLSSFQILVVDLASFSIEDGEDFDVYLSKNGQQKKEQLVLFILNADLLLAEKKSLLSYLNSLPLGNPCYSLLFFFNKNITLSHHLKKLSSYTTLYQNICFYPHYQKADVDQFLFYLEKKFQTRLSFSLKTEIFQECGGYLWLIEEAVRYYSQTKDKGSLFNHEEMKLRLRIIFDEFDEVEKRLLEKIIKKDQLFDEEEKECLDYFLKIGLLKKSGCFFKFSASLLEEFIKEEVSKRTKITLNEIQAITINGIVVDGFFSRREKRFLKYLLNSPNTVVSREKAAALIWRDEVEGYTDWALDQFIRRLRNKFEQLGLPRDLITTKKNQGFIFINH